jgi:hypothetical protein
MYQTALGRDYVHGSGAKATPMKEVMNELDPRAAKDYSWHAEAVYDDVPVATLKKMSDRGPWIALMRTTTSNGKFGSHSVVVDGIDSSGNVMIRDPAHKGSRYQMTGTDFNEHWTGISIVRR